MEQKEQRVGMPANITPLQQALASCTGALLTSLLVTPLDVVKIRLQAQQSAPKPGTCFVYSNGLMDHICALRNGNGSGKVFVCTCTVDTVTVQKDWFRRNGNFTGTLDAFVKIARYEGIASLWSGLPPTLVMAVPATMVYFTVYDRLKYAMGYRELDPTTKYTPVLAGSLARVLAGTLISPLELIRTKMQSEQLNYHQLGTAIKHTVEQGGFLMMMRGLGPTLLRDVPFSAIYWFGYEYMKSLQMKVTSRTEPTFTQTFVAGASAGTVAALITLPFDVVKTHRQIALGQAEMFQKNEVSSTWVIIANMYRDKGVSALFAGIVPRVIKVAPACAIMISSYEYGKAFFHKRNLELAGLES